MAASSPAPGQVLVPITIDGQLGDWSAVLGDPLQRSDDGPAAGLADRDAPVQSTGRDLATFAWTYDPAYLYFYVARVGSAANIQRWWFYLDISDDGLLQSGEPVLGVSWKGSNRRTDITLYSYGAVSAAGDPLGDPQGFADGWDMPGTIGFVRDLETLQGGSDDGLAMETRISWMDAGVAYGTPVQFHVASSNSSNIPQQLDDNMGGPGGRIGTTRLGGVSITPDGTGTVVPGGFGVVAHLVTNTGQSDDRIDLDWSAAGDFLPGGVSFYLDDGDGALGPADTLLTDTTGDGLPNTAVLPAGGAVTVLAVPSVPAGVVDGQTTTVTVTASSAGGPLFRDTVTDVFTVVSPGITLVKSVDRSDAAPGDVITYTVSYTSDGNADAHTVTLVDPIPPPTVYVAGSASGTGATIEFSHDGGGTFDGSETLPVTHIRWSFASPMPPGVSGNVSFQVLVP
ncbi:MAG: hypothetical protein PVF68_07435 [Acidobacteriota bacterium]|jgi:uncharacterized repeat protein (TIGR01451 family)